MEKLQPILVHKFWILFGLAIILPLVGWWMATGELKAEIETRTSAIESAFGSVPSSDGAPNAGWKQKIDEVNAIQQKRFVQSSNYLWSTQEKLMEWPGVVRRLMADVPYRGEIPNRARTLYRSAYDGEVKKVRDAADPYLSEDGSGKVDISYAVIPHIQSSIWRDLPPTTEAMWDAQEDIWLLASIMEAFKNVNKDASGIQDAPLKLVSEVRLMGGNRATAGGIKSAGGDKGDATATATTTPNDGFQFKNSRGSSAAAASVDFDPTVEIGSTAGAKPSSDAAEPTAAGGGGAVSRAKRYVDEEKGMPFKTRAFYIRATMDHRKVPELVAELTNMPWPVEIFRVQVGESTSVPQARTSRRRGPGNGLGGLENGFNFAADPAAGAAGRPNVLNSQAAAAAAKVYKMALSDSSLGTVVIGGVMTLYNPSEAPKEEAAATDEPQPAEKASPKDSSGDASTGDSPPATPELPEAATRSSSSTSGGDPPRPNGSTPELPAAATRSSSSASGGDPPRSNGGPPPVPDATSKETKPQPKAP